MCLLIWIILFNWIILMESGSLPLWGAQTNGEQLASSCDQPLAFIRRQLQAPQEAWQDGVPTAPIRQHFCSFPCPPHVQGEPTWASLSPSLGSLAAWATGFSSFVPVNVPYLNAHQTFLTVHPSLPSPVWHVWPPLHWHLRKCRLLICYWSFFTLIFSKYLGKGTGMICF